MVEDLAGDRSDSRVVLPLRPLRSWQDQEPKRAAAAALAIAGGWWPGAGADVLRLAADAAGPRRLSSQPVVDVGVYGRLAIAGSRLAQPPAIGPPRAHSGRRAGRDHYCARDAHAPRRRIQRDRVRRR